MAPGDLSLRALVLLLCALTMCSCHKCIVYEQTDPEVISWCASLMADLEASLLADKNNRHVLREIFTSSMYSPPSVICVEYTMIYTNDTELNNEFGWSSSSVYTVVDPLMIFTLETGIFAATNFKGPNSFLPHISLVLDIRGTSIESLNYSKDELSFAMETLTTRLKVYAHQQQEINLEADSENNKGYSWKLHPLLIPVSAELALLLFVFAASFKVAPFLIKRLQGQESVQLFPAIFWAISIVAFFWNLADLMINFLFLYVFFYYAADDDERYYAYCKLAVLSFISLFGLVWMFGGCYMASALAPPPRCVCCTCFCTKSGKTRYLYGCAFLQIALFVFQVAANVIPITILLFVHPVIVISDIALLSTIVFSLVIWIMVPFSVASSGANISWSRKENIVCYLFLLGVFVLVVFNLVILYLKILRKGAESDDYYKLVFSFIPSAAIGGTGFLIKRKFLDKRKRQISDDDKDLPSEEDHTRLTKITLEDLERGLANSEVPEVLVPTETGASQEQDGSDPVDESRANADPQTLDGKETTTL